MHPSRSRSALLAVLALLALVASGLVALAAPASAASTDVRINEFSSNNPDFIELINTGSAAVDLTGWVLKDNTDNNSYTFPSGSLIAAGARKLLNGEGADFVFGLGNGDSVRLFAPGGVLADSADYPAHPPAGKSYSRCPEGTGSFVTTGVLTKGTANDCPAAPTTVRINEFSSNNPDFIELINTGSAAVDLTGWVLKDNTDNNSYTFPSGSLIAAGARKLLNGEGVDFVFGLGNGDSVRLFAPGGVLADSADYPAHPPAGKSYSRCPEGTGSFVTTSVLTKGTANDCVVAPVIPDVTINEVESNGDQVADWVELKNNGTTSVDVSGWKIVDGDASHAATPVVVPANTSIPAGGYHAIYTEIAQSPGFGLGVGDSVNLFLPDGTTQIDSTTWGSHPATTWGRCPDGTGAFRDTTTPTRGLANACSPIRINEVESSGGTPGDWIELKNISGATVDISGWRVRDSGDAPYTIPSGTSIAAHGYLVLDEAQLGFGLGGSDAVRLYDATDTLVESHTWTAAAAQTYGRCKDGVGSFVDTKAPTKGAANSCPGLETLPWPGGQTVSVADQAGTFLQDLSGLVFDPTNPDVLWAAQNKKGTLFKLVRDGSNDFVPAAGWPRDPKFANGQGSPDSEGITIGPDGFVYLTTERDNDASGVSRNTVLRFDPNAPAGATITPTTEWNLTPLLPTVGANLGLEGITFVPDSYLTAQGFKDQSTNATYDPANYPGHGSGLFFVAYENNGHVYAFALDADGTPHKVADIDSGFAALADVGFDAELGRVRAVTDDTFDGKTSLLTVGADGNFVVDVAYDRPAGMPNLNNEGLAVAPQSRCANGFKEVVWSDDGDTDGHSIRRGTISCTARQTITFPQPADTVVGGAAVPVTATSDAGLPVTLTSTTPTVCSVSGGSVTPLAAGTCSITATQDGDSAHLPASPVSRSLTVAKAGLVVTTRSTNGLVSLLTLGITYTTTVRSAETGAPVAGLTVTTRIDTGAPRGCTAVTNAQGVATCTAAPAVGFGVVYTARVAESANHLSASASAAIKVL